MTDGVELPRKILVCLRKFSPKDMSITEISVEIRAHRNTVSKYVAILEAGNKIVMTRRVENAKLFKIVEK